MTNTILTTNAVVRRIVYACANFFSKGANVTEWRKKRPQFVVSHKSSVNRDILILTAVVSDFLSARLTRKTWTFEDQRVCQT